MIRLCPFANDGQTDDRLMPNRFMPFGCSTVSIAINQMKKNVRFIIIQISLLTPVC
jgi:hypothetical protein